MTVMTTTFIPCGAKLPIHRNDCRCYLRWIFAGLLQVLTLSVLRQLSVSGIILKEDEDVLQEILLHSLWSCLHTISRQSATVLRSMWERGWSFIKKAGTIILLSTIVVWFTSASAGLDGSIRQCVRRSDDCSILAKIGGAICLDLCSLWDGATGRQLLHLLQALLLKENIVGTIGYPLWWGWGRHCSTSEHAKCIHNSKWFLYSFVFNLLCAPCFAAMGAIKREMNSAKWTLVCNRISVWFRIPCIPCCLQNCRYSSQVHAASFGIGTVVAILIIVAFFFLLFRPDPEQEGQDKQRILKRIIIKANI